MDVIQKSSNCHWLSRPVHLLYLTCNIFPRRFTKTYIFPRSVFCSAGVTGNVFPVSFGLNCIPHYVCFLWSVVYPATVSSSSHAPPRVGRFNLQGDAESSQTTTPVIIEYEHCGQDTRASLRHQAADDSSSYYSCPPGQVISARGYSQSTPPAITGAAAGRMGGGGTGLLQAAYFGAASVEAARNDPGQQHCVPWVPPASASQPTSSQEVEAQPATNSRPRRGVARPLSYQEPSLNIKMRK